MGGSQNSGTVGNPGAFPVVERQVPERVLTPTQRLMELLEPEVWSLSDGRDQT